MIKNKKGFLLAEETLKLVIAVIAIGFLAYFLVSLYFSVKNSDKLEQAKETLSFVIDGAKSGKTSIDIYNPKDWYFISFNQNLPQTCSNQGLQSCICLCKENSLSSCNNDGFCIKNEDFSMVQPIKIENPPITLQVDSASKLINKI